MRAVRSVGAALALPVVLIAVWWLTTLDNTDPFVPEPRQLVDDFVHVWLGSSLLWDQVVPSLTRLVVGLGAVVVGGIVLGVVIGSNRVVRKLVSPLLEFIRAVRRRCCSRSSCC